MRITTKTINNVEMEAYNDSNISWVVSSIDSDGYNRVENYSMKKFTLKHAMAFHSELYKDC